MLGETDAIAGFRPPSRRERWAVAALFSFALALRLLHLQQIQAHDPFFERPSVDERMYHEWALAIAGGDWLGDGVFLNGPLYPYLLASIYGVAGPHIVAAKALQCVLGALGVVLVWALARRLFDGRVGLLAGLLLALYEMAIFYEGTLVVANVLTFLCPLALLAVVRALDRPTPGAWLLAGAVVGSSIIARPNALLFALLIALWIPLALHRRAGAARRAALCAAFAAGAALVVLPVTLRNAVVGDDFVLVTHAGGLNFYLGNNPDARGGFGVPRMFPRSAADDPWEQREVFAAYAERAEGRELAASEVSDFWVEQALVFIREQPGKWLALELRKLDLALNAFESWNIRSVTLARDHSWVLRAPLVRYGLLTPLALLGILLTLRHWRRLVPLYAMLASVLATLLVFFVLSRYRMPAVPVLAVFAGAGVVRALDGLRAGRARALAVPLALSALFALGVQRPIAREDLSVAYYNLGNRYKEMGQWERSIGSYQEALSRNPGYLSAYNNLALVYETTGVHDAEAIRVWEYILEVGRSQQRARYVDRAERHLRTLRERTGGEVSPTP